MEKEIWKNIEGFENYQISSYGRIRSLKFNKEKILKPIITGSGYYKVDLYKNKKKYSINVHRLVAEKFIENKYKKPQVNHIDSDKLNNNVTNLEWCTASENIQHAYNAGLMENTKKAIKESRKMPVYSSKLDLKFDSIVDAATYIQEKYFKDIKLECLQQSISLLLANKITKSRYNYGWSYV